MRNFRRVMLLGILLSSSIPLVSMEQALEELEEGASVSPSGVPNQPTSNFPPQPGSPLPVPPQSTMPTPPLPTSQTTPPPVASTTTPPPAAPTPPPPAAPTPPPAESVLPPAASTPPPALPPAVKPNLPPAAVDNLPPAAQPTPPPAAIKAHKDHHVAPASSVTHASQPAAKATLQIVDVESPGLDTINIDSGGNWLEKRIWFKKAEILFDDIRKQVEQAADIRMDFVDAVNAVGKKVDNFYDVVSYDKGQIDEFLKNVLRNISDASIKRDGDLSSQERSLHLTIQTEQKQIAQIGDDIKKVEEFDVQMDKTMNQAFKTIDACRALESKAWDKFKAIGSELDDKKARTLYYEMDNAQKNIEQHINYLKSTLLPYLQNKLVASMDNIMTTILNNVKTLEAKGVNLQSLLNSDEKADLTVEKEREAAREKAVEATWEKEEKEKEALHKEQENVVEKKAKKKQQEDDIAWYMKFFTSMSNKLQQLGCFLWNGMRTISCYVFEIAPGFFKSVSEVAKSLWAQIVAFCSMLPCYFKCIVCSIRSWLCELFGK